MGKLGVQGAYTYFQKINKYMMLDKKFALFPLFYNKYIPRKQNAVV